jgi:hypothetical protein
VYFLYSQFVKEIVISYVEGQKITKKFQSWEAVGCKLNSQSVDLYAAGLAHGLMFPDKLRKDSWTLENAEHECTIEDLKRWLMACCDFNNMQTAVFQCLYFGADTPTGDDAVCLFPTCTGVTTGILDSDFFPSELDMASIAFLNAALPSEVIS